MDVAKSSFPPQHISFFGDSSSHGKAYMVAGGFAVAGTRIREIEDQISTLRENAGITSEFRWSNYRGGAKQEAYEALIQYGFGLIKEKKAALHLIVARFEGYNHKARPGENRETSVNRMYYQLCLHRIARLYGGKCAVHIRLDAGNDSRDICKMRNELCAHAFRKYQTQPNCIRSIEPVNSQKVGLIQLADVVVGAVAAKRNEVNHTSPKGALADYVLAASGQISWSTSTPSSKRFFTVWQFKGK